LLLTAGVSLAAFFAGTPFALLDYQTFLKDIAFTTVASSHQEFSNSFEAAAREYFRFFLFPNGWLQQLNFIGILIIAGGVFALVRHRAQDLLLLIFPIVHFLFFTEKTKGLLTPHYLMPMLPFFALSGAVFFAEAMAWISRKVSFPRPAILQRIKTGAALLICLPAMLPIVDYRLRNEADTANLARKWIETNIPAGARILNTDYHNLSLKQNIEGLYEEFQVVPKEKLMTIENYHGPTYHIEDLHKGWLDEARESVQEFNYLPHGVILIDYTKFSLRFWLDRRIEYAIVFRNTVTRYLSGRDGDKFPAFRQFYTELLANSTLIKEFKPDPPLITGWHIQIFRLNPMKNSKNVENNHIKTK
jgi:hypothetical protein